MKYILPILAMVSTVGATLVMLVFHVAGAPNASPEQIRSMKFSAGGLSLLAVACLVVSLVLLRQGRAGWAAAIAFLPTVVMVLALILALL